jgi:hypothetical protein
MDTLKDNSTPDITGTTNATPIPSTPPTSDTTLIASTPSTTPDESKHQCSVVCSIRRKPNNTALPGQDPAERTYKVGASLDLKTRANLKGVTGDLEMLFMPSLIGISDNDPLFRRNVDDYWASISRPVPHDEVFLKDHEKGIAINIKLTVLGKARKERLDSIIGIEDKVAKVNELIQLGITKSTRENPVVYVKVDDESVSDYLLLNYCLRYSKVANKFEDIDKSPKIDFYIFEKAASVKAQLNKIELRNTAVALMQDLATNSRRIDAVLLMFSLNPKDFDTDTDKLLKIDELAFSEPVENMVNFVNYAKDEQWEDKYLVYQAVRLNKVRNAPNTTSYYFNDDLLGLTLSDAVNFLNNEEKGKKYKETLLREIQLK